MGGGGARRSMHRAPAFRRFFLVTMLPVVHPTVFRPRGSRRFEACFGHRRFRHVLALQPVVLMLVAPTIQFSCRSLDCLPHTALPARCSPGLHPHSTTLEEKWLQRAPGSYPPFLPSPSCL